jgi:outer membrane protein OmpA-like peptidoglycan-associated protein
VVLKRFYNLLFWCSLAAAQTKLEPDAAGCVDSKTFPKLISCRIDDCEKKEADHRDIPVREDASGQPVTTAVDGESRSITYECSVNVTPASIVQRASTALHAGGFQIVYQFADKEGTLTAVKGELWVLIEAASKFYTLVEMKAAPPEVEVANSAAGLAEALERDGHIPVTGIQFLPGRAELMPNSDAVLEEIAKMLEDHPEWRILIESHTDNTGSKAGNLALSTKRASGVANWLARRGVNRRRVEFVGKGDTEPVAENATEAGRAKNARIELVRLASQ